MIKRTSVLLTLIFMMSISIAAVYGNSVSAQSSAAPIDAIPSQPSSKCSTGILTLPTWYRGLTKSGEGCTLKSPSEVTGGVGAYIWIIVLNIIDILFQLVGYAAVIFIIIGGYFYLTSNGDPNKSARGRTTITNAVIGIAIAIGASAIVREVASVTTGAGQSATADAYIQGIINLALTVAGTVAVVVIVLAGIRMAASSGDPANLAKARNTILYAVIGLVIIFAAWAITDFVLKGLQ